MRIQIITVFDGRKEYSCFRGECRTCRWGHVKKVTFEYALTCLNVLIQDLKISDNLRKTLILLTIELAMLCITLFFC